MNKEELRQAWQNFTEDQDFILNPDSAHVDTIVKGVLDNEKKFGLKLCPCQIRDNTKQRDLELLCPCNFKVQDTWIKQGRCWCGLFVKR